MGLSSTMDNFAACCNVVFSGNLYPLGVAAAVDAAAGAEPAVEVDAAAGAGAVTGVVECNEFICNILIS